MSSLLPRAVRVPSPSMLGRCALLAAVAVVLAAGAARAQALMPPAEGETTPFPHVAGVYPVSGETLCVVIRHGKTTPGRQVPYENKTGDQLAPFRYHNWLQRDGKVIGTLAGPRHDVLYLSPRLDDQPLDARWAADPAHYRLACTGGADAAYSLPQAAQAVHRKSRPTNLYRTDANTIAGPSEHLLYLTFAAALKPGAVYRLEFPGSNPAIAPFEYQHDPRQAYSEAVHVSQVGFRPDDPLKLAFLSLWMGDGGGFAYPQGLPFELIRVRDGRTAFQGKAELAKRADEKEMPGQVNHTGADLWRLDFSRFNEPGEYRVYVEGVGCSLPFPISGDAWANAYYVSVRGLYHQRSGIAIGPPYTTFTRPRPFHPDDGVVVHVSSAAYVEPGRPGSPDALFVRLVAGDTGRTTTNAWGGYMDAGDWDRRIEHLVAARCLLDLVSAYPAAYEKLKLNIPESGNALPDMVDEALFGLDCYRRMQRADGSVPAGIESAQHPRHGECSWQESLAIYQYAPDPWATAMYAATAAQAARVLQRYDRALSDVYRETALRAMDCLAKQAQEGKLAAYGSGVTDGRNLAAVHLYALTGDARWHDLFKETTAFARPTGRLARYQKYDQGEAALAYLQLPEAQTEATIRKNARYAILTDADHLIAAGKETGFGWTGDPGLRIGWGRLTTPRFAFPLIYAYRLTHDAKYLEAMIRACQYGAGANPLNLCFTTGVGKRWPEHVLNTDAVLTNQPTPPGLTALGPQEWFLARTFWLNPYVKVYPEMKSWPACEAYFDTGMYTISNEPTVHNSITPTFYMWGHLAAR